jgi:hypothetical protein
MKGRAASARDALNRLLERVGADDLDPGRPTFVYVAWALTQLSR